MITSAGCLRRRRRRRRRRLYFCGGRGVGVLQRNTGLWCVHVAPCAFEILNDILGSQLLHAYLRY
jgi:hypothetical protein